MLLGVVAGLQAQDTIDTTYYRYNFHRPPKMVIETDDDSPIVYPLMHPTLIDSVTGQNVTDSETGEPVNLCPNGLGFTGIRINGVTTWYLVASDQGRIPLYWVCKMRQPTNTIYGLSIFLDHITDFTVGDTTKFILAERSHETGHITPFDTIVLKGGEIGISRQLEVPLMLQSLNESRYSVRNSCIDSVAYAKVMEFYLETPHQLDGDTLFISPRAPSRFDNGGVGSNFKVAYIDAKYLAYNMFAAIREDSWWEDDHDLIYFIPETDMLYATPIIEPLPEWEVALLDTLIPMPTKPDNPDPGDPQNPDDPNNPDDPDNPDNPSNPDNPQNPDNPDNPQDPQDPEDPGDPEGIDNVEIQNSEFEINIFPNPTESRTTITCDLPMTELTLCDLMGRSLTTLHNCGTSATLDLSEFAQGLYLIKVKTSKGSAVRKLSVR